MFTTTTTSRAVLATAAATAALTLTAACGSSTGTGSAAGGAPASPSAPASIQANPQDVAFATNMIGHHRQAVQMASIVPARNASPQVKTLAAKIQAAQQPEIDTMSGWLRAWGKPVPMEGMGQRPGMNMPGMMSATQMDQLNAATGPQFDKLFLQMMTAHHQGAITMAKAEQVGGKNTNAKALADKVITDQSAEITQMQTMLGGNS